MEKATATRAAKAEPKNKPFTDKMIAGFKADKTDYWKIDAAAERGMGRLVLRVMPSDSKIFYYRYTDTTGKRVQLRLGTYAADASQGMTLALARKAMRKMQSLYMTPEGKDVREHLAEKAEKETLRRQIEAAQRSDLEKQTLKALYDLYVAHLEGKGKAMSARDAKGLFKLHIGALGVIPAAKVLPKQIAEVLGGLIGEGKARTAGKLRSYLSAAYSLAARAENDPKSYAIKKAKTDTEENASLVAFGITSNPVTSIPAKDMAAQARNRHLNDAELKAYMGRLKSLSDTSGQALWVALLLGGQRVSQLLRLKESDLDLVGVRIVDQQDEKKAERTYQTLRLQDPKGKRTTARVHMLPMTAEVRTVFDAILAERKALRDKKKETGEWIFSNNAGRTPMRMETLSTAVHSIEKDMKAAKEIREHFQMRDLRRTCETMLSAMGVSKDLRAQLLSHGITGVQDKHYDQYTFLPDKLKVLEAWAVRLKEITDGTKEENKAEATPATAEVIHLGGKAA